MDSLKASFFEGFCQSTETPYKKTAKLDDGYAIVEVTFNDGLEKESANLFRGIDEFADRMKMYSDDVVDLLPQHVDPSKSKYGIVGQGGEGIVGRVKPQSGEQVAIKNITDEGTFARAKQGLTGSEVENFEQAFPAAVREMDDDAAFPKIHESLFNSYSMPYMKQLDDRTAREALDEIASRRGTRLDLEGVGQARLGDTILTDLTRPGNIRVTREGNPNIVDFATEVPQNARGGVGQTGREAARQSQMGAEMGFN